MNLIPVLTANKAFVLGYTEDKSGIYSKGYCIILDDFTLDLKYVTFPFKVKSSAIKILTPKANTNLRFVYEYLLFLSLKSEEHRRHYISDIAPLPLKVPNLDKQEEISSVLEKIEKRAQIAKKLYVKDLTLKNFLLRRMFI